MPQFFAALKFIITNLLGGLGLVPWCSFFYIRGGTPWRTLVISYHLVHSCMAWKMSNSGQTLSSSPGHKCWCCHWSSWTDYLPSFLPLAFLAVHSRFPMGHSNDPYLSGSNRLAGHCSNRNLERIRFTNSREKWSLPLPGEECYFFLNQSGIVKDNI